MNTIGLDNQKTALLAEKLNELLANYQILYMNIRGYHWNIKGDNFFELHAKFEELYNEALTKIDEIAERTLTIGAVPFHSFTDYIKAASIQEETDISEGKQALRKVVEAYQVLLPLEREIVALAGEAQDEGTLNLISDYISDQEKQVWMFNAYLQ